MQIPEWIISSVTTGLTALLGVGGKYAWDYLMEKKQLRQTRIEKLEKLKGLLNESNGLFKMQNRLVTRLAEDMIDRLSTDSKPTINGFEAFFTQKFDSMTESEKETHAMIRATTLNSINRINGEMLTWLTGAHDFKSNSVRALKKTCGKELADILSQLELHLNLWQDKFAIWMANEKHCVVYLDDEEHHGVGFPKGIDSMIERAILDLKDSAPFKSTSR
jgi:hypothetical protein